MTDRTFTVAGTSVKKGVKSLRVANGTAAAREKVLLKDNHTDVRLFDLPRAMTKEEATAWLEAQGDAVPVRAAAPVSTGKRGRPAKAKVAAPDPVVLANMPEDTSNDDAAKVAHSASWLNFMSWDELTREARNEFRAEALKKEAVAA